MLPQCKQSCEKDTTSSCKPVHQEARTGGQEVVRSRAKYGANFVALHTSAPVEDSDQHPGQSHEENSYVQKHNTTQYDKRRRRATKNQKAGTGTGGGGLICAPVPEHVLLLV